MNERANEPNPFLPFRLFFIFIVIIKARVIYSNGFVYEMAGKMREGGRGRYGHGWS